MMETVFSIKPLLAVLVSAAAVPFLIWSRNPNTRETWTFAAAFVKFGIVLSMLPAVLSGTQIVCKVAQVMPVTYIPSMSFIPNPLITVSN